jgi:hypothetical protein
VRHFKRASSRPRELEAEPELYRTLVGVAEQTETESR